MRRRFAWLFLLLAAPSVHAGSADLNLHEDAVRGTVAISTLGEKVDVDVGWLHQQDKGDVGHVGVQRVGDDCLELGEGRTLEAGERLQLELGV